MRVNIEEFIEQYFRTLPDEYDVGVRHFGMARNF
jgi:hypothetical protein